LFIAASHSFCVAKPASVSRRRSSVSLSSPPHFGQLLAGRRSTQKRLLQSLQRCAAARPTSTMYSQDPALVAAVTDVASHRSLRLSGWGSADLPRGPSHTSCLPVTRS
jgi:hypothetical protein